MEAHLNSTVVIVDSNEHTVAPVAAALADAGYATSAVYSYGDAERRLEVSAPDVLVVSVELGAYNGLQLAMKCSLSYPTTRVIVIGPASGALERDAFALGASAYMTRPLAAGALIDRLNRLAPDGRSHGSTEPPRGAHAIGGLHASA